MVSRDGLAGCSCPVLRKLTGCVEWQAWWQAVSVIEEWSEALGVPGYGWPPWYCGDRNAAVLVEGPAQGSQFVHPNFKLKRCLNGWDFSIVARRCNSGLLG